jgi:hypothetical protein
VHQASAPVRHHLRDGERGFLRRLPRGPNLRHNNVCKDDSSTGRGGCTPLLCDPGRLCGSQPDGCSGTANCGTCAPGQQCVYKPKRWGRVSRHYAALHAAAEPPAPSTVTAAGAECWILVQGLGCWLLLTLVLHIHSQTHITTPQTQSPGTTTRAPRSSATTRPALTSPTAARASATALVACAIPTGGFGIDIEFWGGMIRWSRGGLCVCFAWRLHGVCVCHPAPVTRKNQTIFVSPF